MALPRDRSLYIQKLHPLKKGAAGGISSSICVGILVAMVLIFFKKNTQHDKRLALDAGL